VHAPRSTSMRWNVLPDIWFVVDFRCLVRRRSCPWKRFGEQATPTGERIPMHMLDRIKSSLGCCDRPSLETMSGLGIERHAAFAIQRCKHCGQHFYYRCDEFDDFNGPTSVTIWYMALSPDEVASITARSRSTEDHTAALPARDVHIFSYREGEAEFVHRVSHKMPPRIW